MRVIQICYKLMVINLSHNLIKYKIWWIGIYFKNDIPYNQIHINERPSNIWEGQFLNLSMSEKKTHYTWKLLLSS